MDRYDKAKKETRAKKGFVSPRCVKLSIWTCQQPTLPTRRPHVALRSLKEQDKKPTGSKVSNNDIDSADSADSSASDSRKPTFSENIRQPAVVGREAMFNLPEPFRLNLEEYVIGDNPGKVASVGEVVETVGSFRFLLNVDESNKDYVTVTGQPIDSTDPGSSSNGDTQLLLDSSLLFALQDAEKVETEDTITYRLDMDASDFIVSPVASATGSSVEDAVRFGPGELREIYCSLKKTSMADVMVTFMLNLAAIVFLSAAVLGADVLAIAIRDSLNRVFQGLRRFIRSQGVVRGDNLVASLMLSAVGGVGCLIARYMWSRHNRLDWLTEPPLETTKKKPTHAFWRTAK
eukprot:gene36873-44734_t